MKKAFVNILLFCCLSPIARAQNAPTATVSGVLHTNAGRPVAAAQVIFRRSKRLTVSQPDGRFEILGVSFGQQTIIIRRPEVADVRLRIFVDSAFVSLDTLTPGSLPKRDLADVAIPSPIMRPTGQENPGKIPIPLPSGSIALAALRQHISPELSFRPRGFGRPAVFLDGWRVNAPGTGNATGIWPAIRNAAPIISAAPRWGRFGVGFPGISGGLQISVPTGQQGHHTVATYELSNGRFRHRITLGHASGRRRRGWYYTVGVTRKWADEGYIPGTFYDELSGYAGVSKQWSNVHQLDLSLFGTWHRSGGTRAITREAATLTNNVYYNPCWGFQNGVKRNARIRQYFQPTLLLHYKYRPNPLTIAAISIGLSAGTDEISGLRWYNAQDPRPDYYQNLPSYFLRPPNRNPQLAAYVRQQWRTGNIRQIDWPRLYAANRASVSGANGYPGRRSWYVLGADHQDQVQYGLAATLKKALNPQLTLFSGVAFRRATATRYRKMLDLLGGDYYLDLNQFAERTYQNRPDLKQKDLHHPNRAVHEGERFDYNYLAAWYHLALWSQITLDFSSLSGFLAAQLQWQQFRRTGYYQNGLFPNQSFGSSAPQRFLTYGLRGGLQYKLSGRHYLLLRGLWHITPPRFENTFIAPRYRNTAIQHPHPIPMLAVEAAYLLRCPGVAGQLTLFAADVSNETQIRRFYHDAYRSFVHYVMNGVDVRHLGVECGVVIPVSPNISIDGAASWMQVFYLSRPDITVYLDNDTSVFIDHQKVYWKYYYAATGPQAAYTVGADYQGHHWKAAVNFNYCDRAYETLNPVRLTTSAVDLLPSGSPLRERILTQQRLPASFFINLQLEGRWQLPKQLRLPDGATLHWRLSVHNVLNNKKIIAGAYQQLRFDDPYRDPAFFPTKYRYAAGRIIALCLSLQL